MAGATATTPTGAPSGRNQRPAIASPLGAGMLTSSVITCRRLSTRASVGRMTTLAFIVRPSVPPARIIPLARAVEAAGIEELWLWEDCFQSGGIAAAAAVLAATERVRVGIGVMPTPLRNVAL